MSETMNLHHAPDLRGALWAGRIMSAAVVVALVADGALQLFAPAQIASTLQETGFAMDLTRVVGPIIPREPDEVRDLTALTFFFIDEPLLLQQEQFFEYARDLITYVNYEGRFRSKTLAQQIFPLPAPVAPPPYFVRSA